jgi:branched-subunit amino acid transport protein
MDNHIFFPLLAVMVLVTYLIRAVPFVLFRRKITNPQLKAFFEYIPYTVLSAMTFPAILYSTSSIYSAAAGMLMALILSWKNKSLLIVAIAASITALAVDLILKLPTF